MVVEDGVVVVIEVIVHLAEAVEWVIEDAEVLITRIWD